MHACMQHAGRCSHGMHASRLATDCWRRNMPTSTWNGIRIVWLASRLDNAKVGLYLRWIQQSKSYCPYVELALSSTFKKMRETCAEAFSDLWVTSPQRLRENCASTTFAQFLHKNWMELAHNFCTIFLSPLGLKLCPAHNFYTIFSASRNLS